MVISRAGFERLTLVYDPSQAVQPRNQRHHQPRRMKLAELPSLFEHLMPHASFQQWRFCSLAVGPFFLQLTCPCEGILGIE
jgi:hypothetical protein